MSDSLGGWANETSARPMAPTELYRTFVCSRMRKMSAAEHLKSPSTSDGNERMNATKVRYWIVAVSMLMAFSLYLNRICLGEIVKSNSFREEVRLSDEQIGLVLGSFFLTYALFQVPAGWLGDRFGARRTLTGFIVAWSLLTVMTGLAFGFGGLLLSRQGCGIAQAGAYPTSGGIVRRWNRLEIRGRVSSLIALGGRLGGTLAPYLTAVCIATLGGWRITLWLYGGLGLLISLAYWSIVRDSPQQHPWCNEAERALTGPLAEEQRISVRALLPLLRAYLTNVSLSLNSLEQFCVNVGWAFLITWLPTYLYQQGVPAKQGAVMVTIVLAFGIVGQLLGGWATDRSVRTFGLRMGRVLPISVSCFAAALAYGVASFSLESAWSVVACCAVVSLMTDLGNPSIWAFMQDVGGRNTGAIFGWANMWGNFGASFSAMMIPRLRAYGDLDGPRYGTGQQLVFLACAGFFIVAGLAACGMNATRPVVPQDNALPK